MYPVLMREVRQSMVDASSQQCLDGRRTIIRDSQSIMSTAHTTTAELKRQVFAKARMVTKKRTKKHSLRSTTIAAYTGVFLLVMSVVAIGYQPPQRTESVANATEAPEVTAPAVPQLSVDQLVATNVAAGIAERAGLPIATNIANLSLSLTAESQLAQQNSNTISKPQIIQPTANSRDTKTYTTKVGDTVIQIAQTFGLSPDTIKFANNLKSDAVEPGRQLMIAPVDGLIYTVKAGDTIDTITNKYKADKERVIAFNDLEFGGLSEGRKIIIPAGSLPAEERPGYVAPGIRSSYSGSYVAVSAQVASASAGNRYAPGNCTWYSYERRMQLGRPIGSFWGNANTWAVNASAAGLVVNKVPAPGAIAQWNSFQGGSFGAGHVAIVESVNSDGSIKISEMNYLGAYGRITERTIDARSVSNFIH
jgi:surface antigen